MESLLLLCFVAGLTIIIFFLGKKRTRKVQKQLLLPPEAKGGWPFIGHLTLLSGPELTHFTLSDMADKYGPIFTIRLGSYRSMVVSSWEIAKECFSTHDLVFSDRQQTAALEHMCYNFATFGFGRYGGYWRELRKISIQKLLSTHQVKKLEKVRGIVVGSLMQSLYNSCTKNNKTVPVDMKKWFADLNMNLMVRIIAGDVVNKEIDISESGEKLHEPINEFFKMMGAMTIGDVLPKLKWLDYIGGIYKAFKKTGTDLDTLLQTWLDFHKKHKKNKNSSQPEEEDSFMAQMIEASDDVAKEFRRYDADIINKATCQTMLLGGTDTMTVTLIWALCLLLNNRTTLKKAQDELDKNICRERQVKESDLSTLVYIRAIIKETLRLYPAGPIGPPRVAAEDCLLAGYHVPAGTRVMVNVWKLHRDPNVWPNPLEFQPERFLTSEKDLDVRGLQSKLWTFGQGRRECPGISFSLPMMELALASLLHGFDIDTQINEAVEMVGSFGVTNMKATPLQVMLTPKLPPTLYV